MCACEEGHGLELTAYWRAMKTNDLYPRQDAAALPAIFFDGGGH